MENKPEQTKYHGAFLFNERLHNILAALDEATVARETETDKKIIFSTIKQNFGLLLALFKELCPEMNEKQYDDNKTAWTDLSKVFRSTKNSFESGNKVVIDFIDDFDVWEMDLRKFAKVRGLIMPDKEEETGL